MKSKKRLIKGTFVLLLACVCILLRGRESLAEEEKVICNGIFIGPVEVGGLTESAAAQAVEQYVSELGKRQVTVTLGEESASINLDQLGYRMIDNTYFKDALSFGQAGNLVKRYKELKDVEHEKVVYEPEFTLDDGMIAQFLEKECKDFNTKPVNAKLSKKNGNFVVKKSKTGKKVSVEDTLEKIKTAVMEAGEETNILIEAVATEVLPKYTTKTMEKCKDVIGSASTAYASSSYSRASNLANAARLMNGKVIYPGEVYSAGEEMSPITQSNGYSMAATYLSGQVVDDVGGGVCQVSTTLYNAILDAELEIVERSNHSMIVGYVEPAKDAAIAGGGSGKDLKFKNNTEAPIYLEAYTKGREITFVLYGEETRDKKNRKVEYVSEVLEKISPGPDKEVVDKTKPAGYRKVEQSSHTGYKARLWKVVYENGKQVSKEQVNYSYYGASPRYVTIGAKEPEKTPKPSETPGVTKTPDGEETEKPLKTEKPKKTKEPVISTPEPMVTEPPVPEPPTPEPTNSPAPEPAVTQEPAPAVTESPEISQVPVATEPPESEVLTE